MAFLTEAYTDEEVPTAKGGTETRTVLKLDRRLAPVKAAVLPLSKTDALKPTAQNLAKDLRGAWTVDYDETQSIGKRYRRQDEVGTPFCITVDFETLEDQAVTIRDRDTMQQERVSLDKVKGYLAERLIGA
jgi:glycyl-tRNA synthetase